MNVSVVLFQNGTTHDCSVCGKAIITLFDDPQCEQKSEGQDVCWPCEEFGGPVDDMPELWED